MTAFSQAVMVNFRLEMLYLENLVCTKNYKSNSIPFFQFNKHLIINYHLEIDTTHIFILQQERQGYSRAIYPINRSQNSH